jgi:hypothetical protein
MLGSWLTVTTVASEPELAQFMRPCAVPTAAVAVTFKVKVPWGQAAFPVRVHVMVTGPDITAQGQDSAGRGTQQRHEVKG